MTGIKQKVEEFITPIVQSLGMEIVEVAYEKKSTGMNLTVYIDKKGGVSLDDCETVHKAIDEPLDELDPTEGKPYTLNVSSPGLDRPIVTDKDFERNIGEVLEIHTFKKIGLSKKFVGQLARFDQTNVVLQDMKGKETTLARVNISKATKYIEF